MKENLHRYLQKWGYVAFVLVFFAICFKLYELDVYVWSCDSEENTGSCLLASRLYSENDNRTMGEKYLRKSCDGKYPLGCYELALFLKDDLIMKKACDLGHKPACEK